MKIFVLFFTVFGALASFPPKGMNTSVVWRPDGKLVGGNSMLQSSSCDAIDPYTGLVLSSNYLFWRIEGACNYPLPSCSSDDANSCANSCKSDSNCASVTYNDNTGQCCKSTTTSNLRNPCPSGSAYDFWSKDCPVGQSITQTYCKALACGPTGIYEDTAANTKWCRCPGNTIKCGASCMNIGDCSGGFCNIKIENMSGQNAGAVNANYNFIGLHDSQAAYQRSDGEPIYLWRVCQYGAWVITTGPGNLNVLASYIYSNAHEPEDITGTWKVYEANGSYSSDNNVKITCR